MRSFSGDLLSRFIFIKACVEAPEVLISTFFRPFMIFQSPLLPSPLFSSSAQSVLNAPEQTTSAVAAASVVAAIAAARTQRIAHARAVLKAQKAQIESNLQSFPPAAATAATAAISEANVDAVPAAVSVAVLPPVRNLLDQHSYFVTVFVAFL